MKVPAKQQRAGRTGFRPGRAPSQSSREQRLARTGCSISYVRYHGHMTPAQRLRQVANLLNGSTVLGLLLARSARCGIRTGPRGLLIATGYRPRLPVAGAFAVGNVVLFRGDAGQVRGNPVLLGHEERHCTQYAWCLGLPFLPLYFLAAGWSFLRTGSAGSGNIFERMAGLEAGGYVDSRGSRRTGNRNVTRNGRRFHRSDPFQQEK